MQELLDRGISTRRGIMCSHQEPCYASLGRRTNLEHSEKAVQETLVIPLYPGMTDSEQDYVIEKIIEIAGGK